MISINLKEQYEFNANKARVFLETECDDFFWNNIDLLLSVKDLCEKSNPAREDSRHLQFAQRNLSSDFVNLVVASYKGSSRYQVGKTLVTRAVGSKSDKGIGIDASLRDHLLLPYKKMLKWADWLLDKGIGTDASDAWLHTVASSFFYFQA